MTARDRRGRWTRARKRAGGLSAYQLTASRRQRLTNDTGKDWYVEGFLAGQVVAYCEAIRRGARVAAQLAFPKMYVAPLTRLIAREGCRSAVESVTSDHVSVWIYRDRTVKRLIDRLASKPGSALDVWSMGKIFGYADRDVLKFIERST